MTDAIGPGSWVEAVRDLRSPTMGDIPCGTVAQIESIEVSLFFGFHACRHCGDMTTVLHLANRNDDPDGGWRPCGWRPMRRDTDFSFLLTTTPQEVEPV